MEEQKIERPTKECLEQMHKIIEGRLLLQADKLEMKMDNMMLRIDMKIQKAITDGIDKYFGGQQRTTKFIIDMIKSIVWLVGFVAAAYYIKRS